MGRGDGGSCSLVCRTVRRLFVASPGRTIAPFGWDSPGRLGNPRRRSDRPLAQCPLPFRIQQIDSSISGTSADQPASSEKKLRPGLARVLAEASTTAKISAGNSSCGIIHRCALQIEKLQDLDVAVGAKNDQSFQFSFSDVSDESHEPVGDEPRSWRKHLDMDHNHARRYNHSPADEVFVLGDDDSIFRFCSMGNVLVWGGNRHSDGVEAFVLERFKETDWDILVNEKLQARQLFSRNAYSWFFANSAAKCRAAFTCSRVSSG